MFLINLLSLATIFLIPVIRSYFFYGSDDSMTHAGYILDIMSTGRIGESNFYPMAHLLVAILTFVSEISYVDIMKCFPAMVSILHIIILIVFTRALIVNHKKLLLLFILFNIPLHLGFHTYFTPYGLTALLMLPLILYTYILHLTRSYLNFTFIFLVFLVSIPFFHILIGFVIIYLFVMLYFLGFFIKHKSYLNIKLPTSLDLDKSYLPILILTITTFLWFINSTHWGGSVRKVARFLSESTGILPVDRAAGHISSAANYYTSSELAIVFINWFGAYILIGIVASLFAIYALKDLESTTFSEMLFLYIFIISFILVLILFFIFPTGVDPNRPLRLLALPMQLFVGIMLFKIKYLKFHKLAFISILILIFISTYVCIFNVHYSPSLLRPNQQVTYMEYCGMEWLLTYKDLKISHIGITTKNRFLDAILGSSIASERKDFPKSYLNESYVGDNFKKIRNNELESDRYLTISYFDEILHITIWEKTKRFNIYDFKYIYSNANILKIYDNGEFKILLLFKQ